MPSKRRSQKPSDLSELAKQASEVYGRLLAFLELASGFTLAVAVCDRPYLRAELTLRARSDAKKFGLTIQSVDISKKYERDFVDAVRSQLNLHDDTGRIAVLVSGIDPLVYRPDADNVPETEGRPPFVARLNFDRERISKELPFPIVLWLEKEAFALLLREAPDLTQWISAHFDFGGVPTGGLGLFETLLQANRLVPGDSVSASLSDENALTGELEKIPSNGDQIQLRKRLMLLLLVSQKCLYSSQKSKAEESAREALQLAKRLHDYDLEGGSHLILGSLQMDERPKRAIHEFELALKNARRAQNQELVSRVLLRLGQAYAKTKSCRTAVSLLRQSRDVAASLGEKDIMLDALIELGTAYSSIGKTEKAVDSLKKALVTAREIEDLRREADTLIEIGDLLEDSEPQKAIAYYQRCLPILARLHDRVSEANCLRGIGFAYSKLGEVRRAISYWERSLPIAAELKERAFEISNLNVLGLAHLEVGELATARGYLDRALSKARASRDQPSEAFSLRILSAVLQAAGETEQAIKCAERALKILRDINKPAEVKQVQKLLNRLKRGDEPTLASISQAETGNPNTPDSTR